MWNPATVSWGKLESRGCEGLTFLGLGVVVWRHVGDEAGLLADDDGDQADNGLGVGSVI